MEDPIQSALRCVFAAAVVEALITDQPSPRMSVEFVRRFDEL